MTVPHSEWVRRSVSIISSRQIAHECHWPMTVLLEFAGQAWPVSAAEEDWPEQTDFSPNRSLSAGQSDQNSRLMVKQQCIKNI